MAENAHHQKTIAVILNLFPLLTGAHLALPPNDSFERELHLPPEPQSLPEFRKPRKLPSINGLRSRIISRHKLEDEASSFGSGASAD